ncbi:hypothetical protein FML45_21445 [Klebsiella variicola]|nr:hypothetical protein [Klebsiella variicola]MBZ7857652.1 hypothetical protein [Klebsiella variicola]
MVDTPLLDPHHHQHRELLLYHPFGERSQVVHQAAPAAGALAAFLAATTHAPIMSTLMICEMTGQYALLPGLLITCVVASVLSRTLRRDSIYRHHVAEHV